jgi:hypothetical protein
MFDHRYLYEWQGSNNEQAEVQLPAEALQELKETINAPENLRIIPTSIHVQVLLVFGLSQRPLINKCT